MAYTIVSPADAGFTPIANTDSGFTPPGSSTAIPTPPASPGMVVQGVDPTYGLGEFILLKGVASTAVGSVVTYNTTSYTTALAPIGSNLPQPIAFAMAATNTTSLWGWYQISGMAVAKKTSGLALASAAAVGVKTAGLIAATGTGKEVEGALTVAKSTTAKTVTLVISRPQMQGRVS